MSGYQNIYIIGFRAGGKTTLATEISSSHGLTFLDTDHKLQDGTGMSIEDIITLEGWEYFRHMEEKILADTTLLQGLVVATGGGIILRKSNRDILKNDKFLTVYLMADTGLILSRLKADPNPGQRPPLSSLSREAEIKETMALREPLYRECADLVLDARESTQKLAEKVMARFSARE